ncbi:MAG: hypothetical protein ACJ8ED_12560 [Xanthobacteraceae bacterium]
MAVLESSFERVGEPSTDRIPVEQACQQIARHGGEMDLKVYPQGLQDTYEFSTLREARLGRGGAQAA